MPTPRFLKVSAKVSALSAAFAVSAALYAEDRPGDDADAVQPAEVRVEPTEPRTDAQPQPRAQQPGDAGEMTDTQRLSYAMGVALRQRIEDQGVPVHEDAFIAGFQSVRGDEPPAMTPQEVEEALRQYQQAQQNQARTPDQPRERTVGPDGAPTRRGAADRQPGQARPQQQPRETVQGAYPGHDGELRQGGQVPRGRVDTATPTTREHTRIANEPDDTLED
jgi:hypothetical protein